MVPGIGVILLIVSGGSFWWLLPKNGKTHWLAAIPGIEAYLPVFITSGLALGVVMMLSAVL
jgi:hypothetical protein